MNADSLSLSMETCTAYRCQVGLAPARPNLALLFEVTDRIQRSICYSNLAMLIRRPRHAPTPQEIIADMLSGLGGVCIVTNVFVQSLLVHLGFDARLVPGYKKRKQHPDEEPRMVHIGIQVLLEAQKYYLDFGNGYPYFAPCRFGSTETQEYGGLFYRLVPPDADTPYYALQHKFAAGSEFGHTDRFHTDLLVEDRPVGLSHFAAMTRQHYTSESFAHLLGCLRLIKSPDRRIYALRYDCLKGGQLIFSDGDRILCQTVREEDIPGLAEREFPVSAADIEQALQILQQQQRGTHHE